MTVLTMYGTAAIVMLAVISVFGRRHLRSRSQWLAAVAAAALWPIMAVGLIEVVAFRVLADHLRRVKATPSAPVAVDSEPATMPMDLVNSLARLAQPIGTARPV